MIAELHFPWMETSILLPLIGAFVVASCGDANWRLRWANAFCLATFVLTLFELIDFVSLGSFEAHDHWPFLHWLFHRELFVVDELSVFLLPLGALIHLVVVLSTLRTKAPRFSLPGTLVSEAILLATFSCRASTTLILLLSLATIPPALELWQRRRCLRVYLVHMTSFLVLLWSGWLGLQWLAEDSLGAGLPMVLLTAATLIRSGILPAHTWISDLYEKATLGTALLYTVPLTGAYTVMRLVLPIASDWALQSIAVLSMLTAVYAAGMALVQREARRMFCYLFLSQASLVLVGLELVTPIGLTGALCMWISVGLSLTGLGITLRGIEARIERISLADYHGLFQQMPMLASFFLLTSLAAIGFPSTIGFVGVELLIEGAVKVYPLIGTMVVLAAALNGIAILSAYFRIFTGRRNTTLIPMHARPAEKTAVLLLTLLILGGGLIPHPGVSSRYHAAQELNQLRRQNRAAKPPEKTTPKDAHTGSNPSSDPASERSFPPPSRP